ncbi:MAG: excinuclease ABC subunit UvrB, partial [Roseibium sp.]|nr:excinuclease ABC subunit UvrB [Roseibium sp.]
KRLQETELAVADDAMARQSDVDSKTGGYKGAKKFGAGGTKEGASGKKRETARDKARAAREKNALPAPSAKVRKNTLDEMTVGRTEVPLGSDDPVKPVVRGKIGAGSYEDPAEEKRRRGRPKKSGRPGR